MIKHINQFHKHVSIQTDQKFGPIYKFLLFLVFALFIVFIFPYCNSADSSEPEYHVKDPTKIHKIILEYPDGEVVNFVNEQNKWILNDTYLARADAIELLLKTITQVRLKFIPARAALEMMNQDITNHGVGVKVYDRKNRMLKSYKIGGVTNDELGTFMQLEGEANPVVVHLPHWEGSLRPRYVMSTEEWRDRTILDFVPANIKSMSIEYPLQKSKSFKIINGNPPSVEPFYAFTPRLESQNPGVISAYLSNLGKISGEAFINAHPDKQNLILQIPFADIQVEYHQGKPRWIKIFPIPAELSTGQIERYWVYTSEGDLILAQRRILGKILRPYDYFFP